MEEEGSLGSQTRYPAHTLHLCCPRTRFTCTILLITTLSSYEVVSKTVGSVLSPGFAEKEEKEDHSPQTQSSLLHTIPLFLPSVLICGRLFEGQDNPVWWRRLELPGKCP